MDPGTKVKIIGGEFEDLTNVIGEVVNDGYSRAPEVLVKSVYRGNVVSYRVHINRKFLEVVK